MEPYKILKTGGLTYAFLYGITKKNTNFGEYNNLYYCTVEFNIPNQPRTLNKLRTDFRCRNFVNKQRVSIKIGTKCAKTCMQCVYIPTELPFCIPPLVVGYGSSNAFSLQKKDMDWQKRGKNQPNITFFCSLIAEREKQVEQEVKKTVLNCSQLLRSFFYASSGISCLLPCGSNGDDNDVAHPSILRRRCSQAEMGCSFLSPSLSSFVTRDKHLLELCLLPPLFPPPPPPFLVSNAPR